MKKNKIVVWGASGHASDIADALGLNRSCEIVGFIDDISPGRRGEKFCGKTILGGKEQLPDLVHENIKHIVLGFGNCSARMKLGDYLLKEGFVLVNVCHPSAVISENAEIGQGTVVLAGGVVGPDCQVGKYCIINRNSTLSHGVAVGDGTHICPGVNIAGNAHIGTASWIGIGSSVIDKIIIGSGSYIGAGSVIVKDIPDGVLAYGNPAHIVRPIDHAF
jgi:UDP-N-acetylbacillosamine N-acetyltransferase